ncbi:hypothetical protein L207DRAFT_195502 [Hyaloscypha variabilis F]|uniref:Uncharacterized protein n=1 Tax=Hyaloscypha variabilis (strain UAMH 11265 / GT02V1 / F) TaxID=1149755 RepID=A0A2J6QXE6_HYAVF|nr:hypothetical protein L207DRAFT_195502 [Hyaloscypha variabilis F]
MAFRPITSVEPKTQAILPALCAKADGVRALCRSLTRSCPSVDTRHCAGKSCGVTASHVSLLGSTRGWDMRRASCRSGTASPPFPPIPPIPPSQPDLRRALSGHCSYYSRLRMRTLIATRDATIISFCYRPCGQRGFPPKIWKEFEMNVNSAQSYAD